MGASCSSGRSVRVAAAEDSAQDATEEGRPRKPTLTASLEADSHIAAAAAKQPDKPHSPEGPPGSGDTTGGFAQAADSPKSAIPPPTQHVDSETPADSDPEISALEKVRHISERYLLHEGGPLLGKGSFGEVLLGWALLPQLPGEGAVAWHARVREGQRLAIKRVRPVPPQVSQHLRQAMAPVMGVARAKSKFLASARKLRALQAAGGPVAAAVGAVGDATASPGEASAAVASAIPEPASAKPTLEPLPERPDENAGGSSDAHNAAAADDADAALQARLARLRGGRALASEVRVRDRAAAHREAAILRRVSQQPPDDAALHGFGGGGGPGGAEHVVQLLDALEDERFVYLVMRHCAGGDLMKWVARCRKFSERTAGRLFVQMLRAVAHCHAHGVVHRDLKPDNFLVESAGDGEAHLRLADFGLACVLRAPDEVLTEPVGSAFFLAPEVLQRRYTGPAADAWSLGVNLYLLLSGTVPFGGAASKSTQVYRSILNDPLTFIGSAWERVSPLAKDLVAGLLEKDPAKRYTVDQALAHAWTSEAGVAGGGVVPDVPLDPAIIRSMVAFTAVNKLRLEALKLVGAQLTAAEVARLRTQFFSIDANADYTISTTELGSALASLGLRLVGPELEKLVAAMDADGNGRIDLAEFITATAELAVVHHRAAALEAFARFDTNGDGFIDLQEARAMIAAQKSNATASPAAAGGAASPVSPSLSGPAGAFPVSRAATPSAATAAPASAQDTTAGNDSSGGEDMDALVASYIEQYDGDGDGRLDFEEFLAMLLPAGYAAQQQQALAQQAQGAAAAGSSSRTVSGSGSMGSISPAPSLAPVHRNSPGIASPRR